MEPTRLGFWSRLWLAFALFFGVLRSGTLGARARRMLHEPPPSEPEPTAATTKEVVAEPAVAPEPKPAAKAPVSDPGTALHLLAIMQREGRFIDFLQEDVSAFPDADIGAAARVVHEGCNRALRECFVLAPVRSEAEGDPVVLEQGFDARRTRVTGNVVGEPPFRGRLAHHGWQVQEIRMPVRAEGHDPSVLAPAEVEL